MKALVGLLLLIQPLTADPLAINDRDLRRNLQTKLGETCDAGSAPSGQELAEALTGAPRQFAIDLAATAGPSDYPAAIRSVAMLGSVGRCDEGEKCHKWHLRGVAAAWCVGAGGLFVTNHHCFAEATGRAHGICMADGRVAPVIKILAGDPHADLCLFQVEGDGFAPLPLGDPAPVGSRVRVVSHPAGRFFTQTTGAVARYHQRVKRRGHPLTTWMSITADFARGSSGGPVINPAGEVVGMVAFTNSIHYGSDEAGESGPLQMVVKNCVPVAAIRHLLEEPVAEE